MRSRVLAWSPLLGLFAASSACRPDEPPCAPEVACPRPDVACEAPFKYDARALEAKVKAGKFGGEVNTRVDEIRAVDDLVERYNARYMSLCTDYRNGGISQVQYARESEKGRDQMTRLDELLIRLENADSAAQLDSTMASLQQEFTLSGSNADLQLDVAIYAKLPDQADYQISKQGQTLSTGSKVFLHVQSSANAYLYLYQIDASGKLTVIFPDAQIPITNPLPAGQGVRIPHGSYTYDVNEKDLGIENLHIVASAQPLGSLADSAQQDQSRDRVADNDLSCGTRGLELKAPPTCVKTRGLVLSDEASAGAAPASVRAKTESGDDAVHVVYSFHHVGDHAKFGKKNARGIEMLTGDAAQANRDQDIGACPGEGELKHMEIPDGALERWCVDLDPDGALLNHGPYRKWHPNGKLWVSGTYDWGERTGKWQTFDEQGGVLAEAEY